MLDGALFERAVAACDAIEVALAAMASGRNPAQRSAAGATLARGSAGIALFHAYRARARQDARSDLHRRIAVILVERSVEALARVTMEAGLYGGFSGIAWTVAHVGARKGRLTVIDHALERHLAVSPWRSQHDLVDGLVGIGVYALERLPRPAARRLLDLIVERLAECADHLPRGVTWFTPPALLRVRERRRAFPYGQYNLGVAHGVAGVIALLAAISATGIARSRVASLLEGAVAWLLAQRLPQRASSVFPYLLAPGGDVESSSLGWCYGDAGIAAVLLRAGQLVGEPAWEREGLRIARHAARRPIDDAHATDASLCHGAAGLGHLFRRMFELTGDPALRSAARRWFAHTLDLRRPGLGVAGFRRDDSLTRGRERWAEDPGWLTGAAGIGLALLAATTPADPAWDRLLLLSSPTG